MKQALINLLIITICLAIGFLKGQISVDLFMPIVTMIFTYFFTKNNNKSEEE